MTIHVTFDQVCTALAGLTITGWDGKNIPIKDISAVSENNLLMCPIINPLPGGFVNVLRITPDTFGTMGSEQITFAYTLTFRYYHATVAAGLGGVFQVYSGLIQNIALIANAILSNDTMTGADNVRLDAINSVGPVNDPAGNTYHGCDIVIYVEQYT